MNYFVLVVLCLREEEGIGDSHYYVGQEDGNKRQKKKVKIKRTNVNKKNSVDPKKSQEKDQ